MRLSIGASVLGIVTAAMVTTAEAQKDSTWLDHNNAARATYARRDFAGYRAQVAVLDSLMPGNPRIVYGLAVSNAQLGDTTAAFAALARLVAMRVVRDGAATDSNLAPLRRSPRFAELMKAMSAATAPVSEVKGEITLRQHDLLTEDVALDAASHTLFVSSIRHRKIVALDAGGSVPEHDFARETGDSLTFMALRVDPARHILYATLAALPMALGYQPADSSRSAIVAYDTRTGALLHRYDLAADGAQHVLGDMTLAPNGDVFVSDGAAGGVYVLRAGASALTTLVPQGEFPSPQTPAVSADEKHLYVPDYVRGIAIVGISDGKISWLAQDGGLAEFGIDGLYRVGDQLIAVQNGTNPARVIRIQLNSAGTRAVGWRVIESGTPEFGVPTHGVVAGNDFYFITSSGWDKFADDGSVTPGATFAAPRLHRTSARGTVAAH